MTQRGDCSSLEIMSDNKRNWFMKSRKNILTMEENMAKPAGDESLGFKDLNTLVLIMRIRKSKQRYSKSLFYYENMLRLLI